MNDAKERMERIIRAQPDDATYDELLRELAFDQMIARGMEDLRQGRVISNDEMKRRIATWRA